ncbi:PilZ domain-containing protein [Leptospira mayottensis]|uniref:PF07614 family protein n=2 Tax=Leptospira mayottensis TaxID=1137606 RepID=A0AA87SX01_9LEPT|nr:PilZ domain-containing protein [Leptospira mayottensis]AXR61985.1 PilZ domain-containing protein [Leptospira mayottensis]AXR65897.1 PilZ domain-containing protein [Leptospira mayottensis]AZQ01564.1 PilZ domain-containing protein [Leptospira mayottensis 200901116]EKS00455.1 PF07614 family protein [Leptospira mayottensis 200901122]TGN17952.1 PilZ domain-containing protein [Leptospira mayottensis]
MAVGRSDSLQELITILETMFGETIIGTDINLVKHLFYYLKADEVEFPFDYDGQRFFAIVESIEETTVDLRIPGATQGLSLRAKISFEIMNILYQFEVVILEFLEESIVQVRIPSELQAASFRKNVRVAVDDLFMNYVILFRSLSGGGREIGRNIQVEQRFNNLMREIKKDNPDLRLVNIIISEYISNVSKGYEVVFFSQNREETFLDSFIRRNDRPLFIPDTSLIINYIRENEDSESIAGNYREEYIRMVLENGQDYADKFFRELQKREIREFIISYLVLPIRLFNDVVGYVRVYTSAMDRYSITPSQVSYLIELTEIFSYSMTKIFIREDNYRHTKAGTRVVDISINGLLFEIEEKRIFQYLKKHNIIKMFVPVSEKMLILRGEVVRYIVVEDGKYHLGVNFFDSNPDDMLILQKYIFMRTRRVLSE